MDFPRTPYTAFNPGKPAEEAARSFNDLMQQRRSVRAFSDQRVSRETIEWCIRAAGSAPSGAHKQPWRFVAVNDPAIKSEIRKAAEIEEREFYENRANEEWLKDLSPLETDQNKDFLQTAPWLIVIFKLAKTDDGKQVYYANESIGIAAGMLLSAIHHAGLVTLTHTPSPMKFLCDILGRPANERAYLLLPVGYAADGCHVPQLERKPLDEILVWNRGE